MRRGAEKRDIVVAAVEREQILAAHAPLDDGHVELRAEQHPLDRLRVVDVAVNLRLRPRRAETLHKRRHQAHAHRHRRTYAQPVAPLVRRHVVLEPLVSARDLLRARQEPAPLLGDVKPLRQPLKKPRRVKILELLYKLAHRRLRKMALARRRADRAALRDLDEYPQMMKRHADSSVA